MDPIRTGEAFVTSIEDAGQFAVLVDDEPVAILSLSVGVFEQIQIRSGFRWTRIIMDPLERIDVAQALIVAAYEKAGKPAPLFESSGAVARFIVQIPKDLPDPPKVAGSANPTTASSTVG